MGDILRECPMSGEAPGKSMQQPSRAELSFRSKGRKGGHTKYACDFASLKFCRIGVSQVSHTWADIRPLDPHWAAESYSSLE
jgi:hypothetical protein